MATLDVAGVIARWMSYVVNGANMFDKTEMMYGDTFTDSEDNNVNNDRCCQSCRCAPGTCVVSDQTRDDHDTSILATYNYVCGCVEICYRYRGHRLGRGQRTMCDGSLTHHEYRQGCLHGLSRTVSKHGTLVSVGWWRQGIRSGTWWTGVEGGGWMVTNEKTDQVIFVYPDMVTALLANINTDTWMAEEELTVCQISTLGLENGIIVPCLIKCDYTIPVTKSISSTVENYPEVCDPYEIKIVEVKESLIPHAGQGLFTKQSVEKGVVIAYFAGVVVKGQDCADSEYSISWQDGLGLDIPQHLRDIYRSTLGHKACHSFSPNCEYRWAVHPRFGKIRAVVTLRPVEAGEEVLTDYKYSYSKAPQWYKDDLSNFLVNNFNMELSDIAEYIKKMESKM